MVTYPQRIRFTHKIYIHKYINSIYDGLVSSSMAISGHPTEDFKIELIASDACRIKIIGSLDGIPITERISFATSGTQYSTNSFDELISITSGYFETDASIEINGVDLVGMPLSWKQTFGPYRAEFGQMGGMSAQIEANSLGLGSKIVHYVRIERRAPLSKDMTFSVNGYDDQIFVPVSDFENISTPPDYIPQEWAFRATKKHDGDE